jgi:hypothetical protein
MNYRTFVDSQGIRWEVWLVLPAAAERRDEKRRAIRDRRVSTRDRAGERRLAPDRRKYRHRGMGVAPGFANGWLCFESDDEKRRLAPVPVEWENADAEGLETLLRAAKRVVRGCA